MPCRAAWPADQLANVEAVTVGTANGVRTWLQDGWIERDRLQDASPALVDSTPTCGWSGSVRVPGNETPQWWGKAPEGKANGIKQDLSAPDDTAEDARVMGEAASEPCREGSANHWSTRHKM